MRGAGGEDYCPNLTGCGGKKILSQSDGVRGEEDYCPNLTGCGEGGGGEDYCPNLTGWGGGEKITVSI